MIASPPPPGPGTCHSTWTASLNTSGDGGTGLWEDNDCGFQGRIRLVCRQLSGSGTSIARGDWEVADQLKDSAACPNGMPEVINGSWQKRKAAGDTVRTCRFYPVTKPCTTTSYPVRLTVLS
jgi:hypothetical protein